MATTKKKEGHVTFSGGQVTLEAPNGGPTALTLKAVSDKLVEDAEERGAWGGKIEFMLTMISNAVGLGENE